MKRIVGLSLAIIVTFALSLFSQSCHGGGSNEMSMPGKESAQTKTEKTETPAVQTICPVMGNTVNKAIHTDWQGDEKNTPKRIYFCCPGCIQTFNKNPSKYVNKLIKMHQPVENIVTKS